jgi:Zn-dependent protease with chaperone function
MRFRQRQEQAQHTSRLLLWQFAGLLLGLVAAVNVALAALYRLVVPAAYDYPALFFATNTLIVVGFVLGGCWSETRRLQEGGGARVAHWMQARLLTDPADLREKRLFNVADEMALASGVPRPTLYLLEREDSINAFVAGWSSDDAVLVVTRGALERLTRDELQALVAHEFGHIREGDLRLNMRLISLVWGLSLLHGWGLMLARPLDERRAVGLPGLLVGGVFIAVGWLGWLAGRMLQAGVSRQRELLADACAVQFTRSAQGLGNVLRKILYQSEHGEDRMRHPQAQVLAAMLIHSPAVARLLATHPPLRERIRLLLGHEMPAIEAARFSDNPANDPVAPARPVSPLPPQAVAAALAATRTAAAAAPRRVPLSALDARRLPPAAAATAAEGPALDDDELEARQRIELLHGPGERQVALLSLMLAPGNLKEEKAWSRLVALDPPQAQRILKDVQALGPASRLPVFELLLSRCVAAPRAERRELLEAVRDLMSADGRVWPADRLRWLAMRHRLAARTGSAVLGGTGADAVHTSFGGLDEMEHQHIAAFSAFLARIVPDADPQGRVSDLGRDWYRAVMARTSADADTACEPPDADGLAHALWGLQEMSWQLRPALLRIWLEEAEARSAGRPEAAAADALRLAALLLNSPLPPSLATLYREFTTT